MDKLCSIDSQALILYIHLYSYKSSDWFSLSLSAGSAVTMAKLLNFRVGDGRVINIAREVGDSYQRLGHYLLGDHTDTIMTANPQRDATEIGQEILQCPTYRKDNPQ